MWVIAMYDLPVDSLEAKRFYRQFRDKLLDDGFCMLQYSVYGRPCPSIENCEVHIRRVAEAVPPAGEVRVITLTDLQFARMRVFMGREPREPEKPPDQLTMF